MIVKNEEKTLPRCLSAVKDFIDYWVIVDTGSRDKTCDVIHNQLSEISGELISREWKNFGHNRTESLQFAKGKADYLLLCDADEELVFSENFNKSTLVDDAYNLRYLGQLDYSIPYLLNGDKNWKYQGVTHEFLTCDEDFETVNFLDIHILDHQDGGSKHDKFDRDIELLTEGLNKEPNNARYMFYLANSHKNINDHEAAIYWYEQRIKIGGWAEEVYCSYLYLGRCLDSINKKGEALETFLFGYNYYPKRAECLYEAIKILRIQGKYQIAYDLYKIAKEIPYPHNDILFIERNVYEYLLDYEYSIIAYYVQPNDDIRGVFSKLLSQKNNLNQNVLSNYKFYSKSISQSQTQNINLDTLVGNIDGYHNSSPSITVLDDGNYMINVRRVSYELDKNGKYHGYNREHVDKFNTLNSTLILDKSFNHVKGWDFEEPNIDTLPVNGLEDVRILHTKKGTHFNANVWNDYGDIKVVEGEYKQNTVLEYKQIKSPFNRNCEKNWAPFLHNNNVMYVYDWDPIILGHTEGENLIIDKTLTTNLHQVRGSSPGYYYEGSYWFLVHIVYYNNPRNYYHSIVELDAETLCFKTQSKWFTFEEENVEFGLGLIIEENRILITYSTWDSTSRLCIYDKNKLLQCIE